jgi:hypothetical protein
MLMSGSPPMCINSPPCEYLGMADNKEAKRVCYWVMYYAPNSHTGLQEHRVPEELLRPLQTT